MNTVSCSWCHASNPTTATYCKCCGHEVGKPRMGCQCPQCVNRKKRFVDDLKEVYDDLTGPKEDQQ